MLNITPDFYIIVSEADSQRSPAQRRGIHYPNLNRDAIISVVNTVTELGKPALFPILPELLAPKSGNQFLKDYCEPFSDVHALFIWEIVSDPQRVLHNDAVFRVRFKLFTGGPHSAGRLAFTLLRLIEDAMVDYEPNIPNNPAPELRDLSYWLGPSSIVGTAYFVGLSGPYANAHGYSCMYPAFNMVKENGVKTPLTTWPPGDREQADEENVQDCYIASRALEDPM